MSGAAKSTERERTALDLRSLGIPEVPMLGRYNYARARSGLMPHSHPGAMEICLLAKGTQLYRVGRQDYVLHGGDVFVTFPGEAHSTGETPEEKGILYWVILILPRSPAFFLNCTTAESGKLVRQLLGIPHRHFVGIPELRTLLDEMISTAQSKRNPMRRLFLRVKLLEFLLKILECSHHPRKSSLSKDTNRLLHHIETQIEEPLSVKYLAKQMGLSVSRFKTRFKQEIGIPPAEYVLRCKIHAAKELLTKKGSAVTEVAYKLGFSSSQYFATVFKRYTGKSPRRFSRDSAAFPGTP